MKKVFACALIFAFLWIGACKKSEKAATTENEKAAKTAEAKKEKPKKKKQASAAAALELYNEKTLVASIPAEQYQDLMTSKIQFGKKKMDAVLLKDLLSKYQLKGKSVILEGAGGPVPLTWEQATTNNVYICAQKKALQVRTTSKNLENVQLPKKLVRITVSTAAQTTQTVATPKQPAGTKKSQNP